jgi:hypothetical protein
MNRDVFNFATAVAKLHVPRKRLALPTTPPATGPHENSRLPSIVRQLSLPADDSAGGRARRNPALPFGLCRDEDWN